jgi:CheY-like chemotaxis protein
MRDPSLDDDRAVAERQAEIMERIELKGKRRLDLRAATADLFDCNRLKYHDFAVKGAENQDSIRIAFVGVLRHAGQCNGESNGRARARSFRYRTVHDQPKDQDVKHVLIVDDDATVLSALGHALKGFRLSLARDPLEALGIAEDTNRLDLVITDFLMPSMTGDELVARVRARHPKVKALIVTGHGDVLDGEAPDWWNHEPHLTKPFGAATLQRTVADLIGPP